MHYTCANDLKLTLFPLDNVGALAVILTGGNLSLDSVRLLLSFDTFIEK